MSHLKQQIFGDNMERVIDFWFKEIDQSQWWVKDAAFDQLIKQRFGVLHEQAMAGELYHWRDVAHGRLAEIILLDQFSRNIFRDTAAAFASDPLSLMLSQEAVNVGADKVLTPPQRSFLYMPFMHSESLIIHECAIELFNQPHLEKTLAFEVRHQDIIKRFGRYPHRNDILGRESTPQEIEFLMGAGSSF